MGIITGINFSNKFRLMNENYPHGYNDVSLDYLTEKIVHSNDTCERCNTLQDLLVDHSCEEGKTCLHSIC